MKIKAYIYDEFKKLNRNEKIKSLRLILSYDFFLNNQIFITKKVTSKLNLKDRYIGVLSTTNNENNIYYYLKKKEEKDFDDYVVIMSANDNKEIVLYEFINKLRNIDTFIFSLSFPVKNILFKEFRENTNFDLLKSQSFDYFRNKGPQFLIGSGVSIDYGSASWDKMLLNMSSTINMIKPKLDAPSLNETLFNVPYGIPQILKDLNKLKYYDNIYGNLYTKSFSHINNSTLDSIVHILEKQSLKNINQIDIVTFNYDDFLEQELNFRKLDYGDILYFSRLCSNTIRITHLHGFMPHYKPIATPYLNSIILTDLDYSRAYSSRFVTSTLNKHLARSTLIVGNSLSDYEERKIFINLRDNDGVFHYALMKLSDNMENDLYKMTYLFHLGIIVLYFPDFKDISDYIRKLI